MKTSTFAFLVLALVYVAQNVYAGPAPVFNKTTCKYECPGGPTHVLSSDADGATACDPSFICFDRAYPSLKQMVTSAGSGFLQNGMSLSTSSEVEKSLIKTLNEAKTLAQAWAAATEAWKLGVSLELQRHTLALAKSMGKSPAELETLNFMLSALENPAAELDRCREWGRGNALEKKKAADHLALLLQNPNLNNRLK